MMTTEYVQLSALPKGAYADAIASAQDIATLSGFTFRAGDRLRTFAPAYKISKVLSGSIEFEYQAILRAHQ